MLQYSLQKNQVGKRAPLSTCSWQSAHPVGGCHVVHQLLDTRHIVRVGGVGDVVLKVEVDLSDLQQVAQLHMQINMRINVELANKSIR
jgi:hypothetical protein